MAFQTPGQQVGFAQQQAQAAQDVFSPDKFQQLLQQLQDPAARSQLAQKLGAELPAPNPDGSLNAPAQPQGAPQGQPSAPPAPLGPPQENSIGLPIGRFGDLVTPQPQLQQNTQGPGSPAVNQALNMQQQAQQVFGPPQQQTGAPPASPGNFTGGIAPQQPGNPAAGFPVNIQQILQQLQQQGGGGGGPFGGGGFPF